jgi:hypothetical protein
MNQRANDSIKRVDEKTIKRLVKIDWALKRNHTAYRTSVQTSLSRNVEGHTKYLIISEIEISIQN